MANGFMELENQLTHFKNKYFQPPEPLPPKRQKQYAFPLVLQTCATLMSNQKQNQTQSRPVRLCFPTLCES